MDGKLIGFLSGELNSRYANQKVYYLKEGLYKLDNGDIISEDTLKQLYEKGMFKADYNPSDILTKIDHVMPDKIDIRNNTLIHPIGVAKCRISPEVDTDYAGQLLYATNMEEYYVTEHGYVLKASIVQKLADQKMLINNELIEKKADVFNIAEDFTKNKDMTNWVWHKLIPLVAAILIITITVIWGIPVLKKQLAINNSAIEALDVEGAKKAKEDAEKATGDRVKEVEEKTQEMLNEANQD